MQSLSFSCKENIPKEIAKALYLTYGTIRWHLANLRKVYNVHSTRELLRLSTVVTPTVPQPVRLSPRGREVMELFMRGVTYNEIAKRLGISRSGVRRHLEKMLWQNECKSMLELIAKYRAWLAEKTSDAAFCEEDG